MSTEKLALVVACALIVVSAVGIAYLTAEQAGAAKRTDIPVDEALTSETRPHATQYRSQAQVSPLRRPLDVAALEPSARGGLGGVSKATAHALVGGAFGAGSLALARNGIEKAVLTQRSQ